MTDTQPDSLHAQLDRPIFISYSRADTPFARQLYETLRGLGFTLWRDRSEMEGGQNWWQQIQEAIEKSDSMVLCMSPAALASPVVAQEWRYARQVGTRVIPVVAAGVDFAAVPRWMKKFDWPDFRESAPEHDLIWPKFIRQLNTAYERQRVPFTAPDLPPQFVARPAEQDVLIRLLLDEARENPVAITTALQGGGGFGKTTLAQAICHNDDVINAFSDGILWITLGEAPNLIALVMDQIEVLTGERPGLSDLNAASRRLGELLEDRDALMVLDDVWDEGHARAFTQGGKSCARLVTTRRKDVAARLDARGLDVNEMTTDEGAKVLVAWLNAPPPNLEPFRALARDLGEWPLLLALAGGYLHDAVLVDGESLDAALAGLRKRLAKRGFTAFDRTDEGQRHRAISLNLDVSLERLGRWRARYLELAIFPDDAAISWPTLDRLWNATAGLDDLDCEDARKAMQRLSLFTRYDVTAQTVRLHDVVRAYLRASLPDPHPQPLPHKEGGASKPGLLPSLLVGEGPGMGGLARLNTVFLASYGVSAWADLPPDEPYLWDHLAYHLAEAGRGEELIRTVLDLRYLAAKTYARDAFAAESDLAAAEEQASPLGNPHPQPLPHKEGGASELVLHPSPLVGEGPGMGGGNQADTLRLLRYQFANMGHLLSAAKGDAELAPTSIAVTLYSRLAHLPALVESCRAFEPSIPRPALHPRYTLPDLPHPSLVRTLAGHTGPANACVWFQHEGDDFILSASSDTTLRVWDARTGQVRLTLAGHAGRVRGCAVAPDHSFFVSASEDHTLRVWDARSGQVRRVLEGHVDTVRGCAVSPDGSFIVSASDDRTLRIWDTATGQIRRVLAGHTGEINGCDVSTDGEWVVSASDDRTLRLWDAQTGEVHRTLTGHGGEVNACQWFQRDGSDLIVSASGDHTLRLWDAQTGQSLVTLAGHKHGVRGCAAAPGGDFVVSASWDRVVRGWDTQTGQVRFILSGHTGPVRGCTVSPDGQFVVSACWDGQLRIWDAHPDPILETPLPAPEGHTSEIRGCATSAGGEFVVSASADRTLRVWDTQTGQIQHVLTGHTGPVRDCAVSPNFIVSASYDRTLRVWDPQTGQTRLTLDGHTRGVHACAVSPGGDFIVSASDDHTLRVWDAQTGETRLILVGHARGVRGCTVSPDGAWIVSASYDTTLRLWDSHTGEILNVLKGHTRGTSDCVVTPDGHSIVSTSDDTTLRVWDVRTGQTRLILQRHTRSVDCCALSPGGEWIASVSWDGKLCLWDIRTGRCRTVLHVDGPLLSCAWLPDGQHIVAGGARGLYWLRVV